MTVNPYFKLRFSKNEDLKASIVCEIKVKGFPPATPFATGISVDVKHWNYKNRRIDKSDLSSRQDNNLLDSIETDIKRIAERLQLQDKQINPKLIHSIYNTKPEKIPCFLECVRLYILHRKESGLSDGSFTQYNSYQRILKRFLESLDKSTIDIEEFTVNTWEQLKRFTERNTHSHFLFLSFIKSVLAYCEKKKYIKGHDLLLEHNPSGQIKELLWLDDEHLERLTEFRFISELHESLRKGFLFQCYTGLAFEEIKNFKKSVNIKKLGGKDTLYIYRKKAKKFIPIPLLKQAKEILNQIDEGFQIPHNFEYNIIIRFFGEIMKYDRIELVSSHLGRKTAGVYLLNNGVPIEVVSRILGHSSIKTTMTYYSTVLTKYLDIATQHLQ